MSNLFSHFRQNILMALTTLMEAGKIPKGLDLNRVTCEPPRESHHGDISTNAALSLAKEVGQPPLVLADLLKETFKTLPHVVELNIAAPGFINFKLSTGFWQEQLKTILKTGKDYGASMLGQGQMVNIEYPSVNPTGPLHVGHCRVAVVGDVLANLLAKSGYKVIRESYINDAGGQALHLARALYTRYQQALEQDVDEPDFYKGDYLIPLGKVMAAQEGNRWLDQPEEEWIEMFRAFAVDEMIMNIKISLAQLGVHLDVYTSERQIVLDGKVEQVFAHLEKLGLIYEGMLEAPKGKVIEDWEPRVQTLFKSSAFGDDTDRPLKKSDGSWTYMTPDIAYHFDKFQRGAAILVDILGADHIGYVKRLTAAVAAVTERQATLIVKICQIVKFLDQGQVLKMSKRAGVFVTVEEAIEKIGKDAIRFIMLTRKNDATLDFDFSLAVQQSRDNPVFYVQYAHARCHSIMRHLKQSFPDLDVQAQTLADLDLSSLTEADDQQLIKILAGWPRQVEVAALAFEPHRIAYYLSEVAGAFHALWNKGKENTELRFIFPHDPVTTQQRLALVWATALVLASGFDILGITAVEEMRS